MTSRNLLLICAPFLLSCSVHAQTDSLFRRKLQKPDNRFVQQYGGFISIGADVYNFDELNRILAGLQLGKLDNYLTSRKLAFRSGNEYLQIDMYVVFADAYGNQPNQSFHFRSTALGMAAHRFFLRGKRITADLHSGFNFTSMQFTYNANSANAASFPNLLAGRTSSVISLRNPESVCIPVGLSIQYKTSRIAPEKKSAFAVGIESGYQFTFLSGNWQESGSRVVVANMPNLKADHVYVHLTAALLFNRCPE